LGCSCGSFYCSDRNPCIERYVNWDKKRTRDYLRDLADLTDPSVLTVADAGLDALVNKVFSDCGAKFKGGGGEFGGAGTSGYWETTVGLDMYGSPDIPITLERIDASDSQWRLAFETCLPSTWHQGR